MVATRDLDDNGITLTRFHNGITGPSFVGCPANEKSSSGGSDDCLDDLVVAQSGVIQIAGKFALAAADAAKLPSDFPTRRI